MGFRTISHARLESSHVGVLTFFTDAISSDLFTLMIFQLLVLSESSVLESQYSRIMFFISWYDSEGFIIIIREASHTTCGVAMEVQDFNQ